MIMENSFDYVPSGAWVPRGASRGQPARPRMGLSVTTRHSSHGVKPPTMSRVAAAGRGFGPVLPPGSGAHGDFGISTEPMM